MNSPFTNCSCRLIKSIDVSKLINDYNRTFNIDIKPYVENNEINIFECLDSGYRFFTPYNIGGDSQFYELLQQFDWYYMPWKWEHKVAYRDIDKNSSILEIGCAKGDFLEKLVKEKECKCVGLEFNKEAIRVAKSKGLEIYESTIQKFSVSNEEKFDIVCSFQVLEHVPEVKEFLEAQIKCLKKGGKLIVSVPNNASFLGKSYNILNMPPHHMGLWNKKSLKYLTKLFEIKLVSIRKEPLQKYHLNWYFNIFESKVNKIFGLRSIYFRFRLKKVFLFFFKLTRKFYGGHTIIVVFEKKM